MANLLKPIVLEKPNTDTGYELIIVLLGCVLIDDVFYPAHLTKKLLSDADYDNETREHIKKALNGDIEPTDLSNTSHQAKISLAEFAVEFLRCNKERLYPALYGDKTADIVPTLKGFVLQADEPYLAFKYCELMGDDADVGNLILNHQFSKDDGINDFYWLFQYLTNIRNNKDKLRKMVLDYNCPTFALEYCIKNKIDDAEMRQVVINSGDVNAMFHYCSKVNDNELLRQAIIDSGDIPKMFEYHTFVKRCLNENLKQEIIKQVDAVYAFDYLQYISNTPDDRILMRQVIVDSGNVDIAQKYCRRFGDHYEVENMIAQASSV